MSDKKVTYLLGAGASYHSMPITDEIPTHLENLKKHIEGETKDKNINLLLKEIEVVINEISSRVSVDSYAKNLFINGDVISQDKLRKLKIILSLLFVYEQFDDVLTKPIQKIEKKRTTHNIDKRYLQFYSHIINKGQKPNNNVRILSWNYDLQLELAYSKILNCSLYESQINLQSFPSAEVTGIDITRFCTFKLNGTAGLYINNKGKRENYFDFSNQNSLSNEIRYYGNLLDNNYNREDGRMLMTFAWEKQNEAIQCLKLAKEVMKDTDILVVIGYSFPRFNREIDRELLNSAEKLSKIYLQVPSNDFESYKSRIEYMYPKINDWGGVHHYGDLKEFFVPDEVV